MRYSELRLDATASPRSKGMALIKRANVDPRKSHVWTMSRHVTFTLYGGQMNSLQFFGVQWAHVVGPGISAVVQL